MHLKNLFPLAIFACSGADPSVSAVESPSSSQAAPAPPSWSSVSESTSCDRLLPASDCLGAYGFSITSAGAYTAGPDPVTGATLSGSITPAELDQLDAAISAVLPRSGEHLVPVAAPMTCVEAGAMTAWSTQAVRPETPRSLGSASDLVEVGIARDDDEKVYDSTNESICFLGAGGLAVHDVVHAIMAQYYPFLFVTINPPL